ncbi:MAG: 7-carboxy-7-deazaguanine synthase [Betaproteobacteria bacterium ADurb.Bin341]|nr:MAG: 7-carboxy-7-deazaguanine synthase [Betaproteobacteria bacterium ADurb.Bin341]
MSLIVSEIFYSLQGEAARAGLPTVFVRLAGCPLRCRWCDSAYAFSGGREMTLAAVLDEVQGYPVRRACVTGGEPLAQAECLDLLTALADSGYDVSLETSGALDIAPVDSRVSRVMDLKAPDSGEEGSNRWENLQLLNAHDEIKFVIASRRDYEWARALIGAHRLDLLCPLLMQPAHGLIEPRELAEWILADALPVRFQMQLHKLLWGNMRGK